MSIAISGYPAAFARVEDLASSGPSRRCARPMPWNGLWDSASDSPNPLIRVVVFAVSWLLHRPCPELGSAADFNDTLLQLDELRSATE